MSFRVGKLKFVSFFMTKNSFLRTVLILREEDLPSLWTFVELMVERKVVVVGDGAVGKTCILVTYTTGDFPVDYVPTIFDNHTSNVYVEDTLVQLRLFDTAGQEEYDRLRPLAYPDTDVFVVCFSTANLQSFKNVCEKWVPEIKHHRPCARKILVGTKIDLDESEDATTIALVSSDAAHIIAMDIGASQYCKCSALTGEGLHELFNEIADVALNKAHTPPPRRCQIL